MQIVRLFLRACFSAVADCTSTISGASLFQSRVTTLPATLKTCSDLEDAAGMAKMTLKIGARMNNVLHKIIEKSVYCMPRPENAPPREFLSLPRPPPPRKKYLLPRPEAKKCCPVHPCLATTFTTFLLQNAAIMAFVPQAF